MIQPAREKRLLALRTGRRFIRRLVRRCSQLSVQGFESIERFEPAFGGVFHHLDEFERFFLIGDVLERAGAKLERVDVAAEIVTCSSKRIIHSVTRSSCTSVCLASLRGAPG